MTRGEIVGYYEGQGYGFIRPDGASPRGDIFFNVTVVEGEEATIYLHAPVEFELSNEDGSTKAKSVKVLKPQMVRGTIIRYFERQGYGFIKPVSASPDLKRKDIFFHAQHVEGGEATIYVGATVECEYSSTHAGKPSASVVRVLKAKALAAAPKPAPTPAPAPKPIDARELPPAVAKALGLIDEPERPKTKRDRVNSAGMVR